MTGVECALVGCLLGEARQVRVAAHAKPRWARFSLLVQQENAEPERVNVNAFGRLAAGLPDYLEDGERLYVEGRLTVCRGDRSEGAKVALEVEATKIVTLEQMSCSQNRRVVLPRASRRVRVPFRQWPECPCWS